MRVVTDSHCHLTATRFDEDRDDVLRRAGEAGVGRIVTIASNAADALAASQLAEEERSGAPELWATAGVHPHEADEALDEDLDRIAAVLERSRTVAVGETGLDFYYDNSPRDVQLMWFKRHLELAAEHDRPVVVHSRNADADVAECIGRFRGRVRGVVHCFTGGRPLLEAALDAGWYIGYGGIATFKRFDGQDLVRAVPADRLLLETDAPYLAPVPHRGKRNEPAFVVESLKQIADIRGEPVEALADITTRNAAELFDLPPARGAA